MAKLIYAICVEYGELQFTTMEKRGKVSFSMENHSFNDGDVILAERFDSSEDYPDQSAFSFERNCTSKDLNWDHAESGLHFGSHLNMSMKQILSRYVNVICHEQLRGRCITIDAKIDDPVIVSVCGHLPTDWSHISVVFYTETVSDPAKWDFMPKLTSKHYSALENPIPNPLGWWEINRPFLMSPKKSMCVVFYGGERIINGCSFSYEEEHINNDINAPIVYTVDASKAEEARKEFVEDWPSLQKDQGGAVLLISKVDRTFTIQNGDYKNPKQIWCPDAFHRATYIMMETILPIAMIFSDTFPVYVLLWLLEWLPWVRYIKEIDRVRMIEGVYSSIRKINAH